MRRFLSAVVLLPLALALPPGAARAQETAAITGTFHVIWRDAASAARADDEEVHVVVDDRGRATELRIDPARLRALGGALALNGRRVTAAGRLAAPGRDAAAETGERTLDVSSLRALEAAAVDGDPLPAVSGSSPYVTILCRFGDFPATDSRPLATYERWMASTFPGADHYWREASEERVNLAGSVVVGWYVLPQPHAYYFPEGKISHGRLVSDCLGLADAEVDFSRFVGVNMQFNRDLGGYSWGGTWHVTLDGPGRRMGMTWMAAWATLATYTHEIGHSFGLPHSSGPYSQVYDSRWDVMSGGSFPHPGEGTSIANHTIGYHKDRLGWVPEARRYVAARGRTDTITISRIASPPGDGTYQLAVLPVGETGVFYTVESRRAAGYDAGRLPGEAVVLHRVDGAGPGSPARVVDPDGNGDPNDAAAMWTPGETFNAEGIGVVVLAATPAGHRVVVSFPAAPTFLSAHDRPTALMGAQYRDQLHVVGTIGAVEWSLAGGELPPGVVVDRTLGELRGIPERAGSFEFTLAATSGAGTATAAFRLGVGKPALESERVMRSLLDRDGALTADELRFLDLLGNRNGTLDAGDVRRWLIDSGTAVPGAAAPADPSKAAPPAPPEAP